MKKETTVNNDCSTNMKQKQQNTHSNTKSSNDVEQVRPGSLPPLMIICHKIKILKANKGIIAQQVCIEVLSAVIR